METYLTVSFWLAVVAIVIRACFLMNSEYPRNQEINIGADVVAVLVRAGFATWCAILLWVM